MILKIAGLVVVLVAALLIFAATKPKDFRIRRSILINAHPEKVFAFINDFHQWSLWAPQDRENPSLTRTYSGRESGLGAISDWKGNGNAGVGRMSIIESTVPSTISVRVDWSKPFKVTNINEFVLQPAQGQTKVIWTMRGDNLYVMKLMSVFVNMDKQMGSHFETGLADLKSAAEK
jgi:uncharacterized protein YndB with AHSA1/START domain